MDALTLNPETTTEARQLDELLSEQPAPCAHPPTRLYCWHVGEVVCVGCCQCGAVLQGAADDAAAEARYQARAAEMRALDRQHARNRKEVAFERAQGW